MTFSPFLPIWGAPVRRLAFAALGLAAAPVMAIGCDELRSSIDARIRATGVGNFSLSVVAASATAPGSVVGSCELGTKKIVYAKGSPGSASLAPDKPVAMPVPKPVPAPAAQPKAAGAAMITECDDGTSVTHGECKKP